MDVVETFMYDLGMLLSRGEEHLDDYVEPATLAALRTTLAPVLVDAALTFRPDFGEYATVTISGDMLTDGCAVTASVDFEDRSSRHTIDGRTLRRPRRRLRLILLLDSSLRRVLDQRFEAVA